MKNARFLLGTLFIALMMIGSSAAKAAAPTTEKLAETDALTALVDEQAMLWRDGNISTGTTGLSVVKITSKLPETKDEWKDLAVELFKDRFKYFVEEDVPANAKLRISAASLDTKEHLKAAAEAVLESNAYDPTNPDIVAEILPEVQKLVVALGDSKDIQFLAIKTRLMDEKVIQAKRNVRIHSFVNRTTSVAIMIFTIEGTM